MKRREFSLGAAAVLASPAAVLAQARVPEDGREYRTLPRTVPVETPLPKIEVIDFFWYSCPHCNAFEPTLQAWSRKLPDDVVLRRIPAAFRDNMVPQQRLFYALEAMGKAGELHVKIFDAIHKENVDLTRLATMADWVGKQGLDAAKFTELYNSFAISAKARRATDIQNLYEVEGVPSMGVVGRYYTDSTLASNHGRMLQVVDYLIGEARKPR
ncbi:thiol:disulfide interchange protein DsbA/DsbL [Ramlibacter sp. PS4R-6]|uniref:thiol:disulfide interchange protein DsbA/DsbL n=1 Tax=Ramlibacter sp. PS4R-6 TaxID=3133438 RepID=UPI0030A42E04